MNKDKYQMSETTKSTGARAPWLVAAVVALHGVVIGAVLMGQGCGTLKPREETPTQPTSANMPPTPAAEHARTAMPTPAPAAPVEMERPPVPAAPEPVGPSYEIQKGDSLSSIAARYGVSWREVAELNGIKDSSKIRVGQKITLPAYARSTPLPKAAKKPATHTAAHAAAKPSTGAATHAAGGTYEVKSGDSLSRIAARNGTTVKALRAANNLTSDKLRLGQKLVLPGAGSPAPVAAPAPVPAPDAAPAPAPEAPAISPTEIAPLTPAPAAGAVTPAPAVAPTAGATTAGDVPFEYTVKPGDTLADVAKMFSVLEQELVTLNGLSSSQIKPGDKIKIPMSP